jgi:amphi-Trp domain-containing protein
MAAEEFRHESLEDRRSIAEVLQALLQGIERGHLELGSADRTLVLSPGALLELEVRARRKGGRSKVTVKFAWREDEREAKPPPGALSIRSQPASAEVRAATSDEWPRATPRG